MVLEVQADTGKVDERLDTGFAELLWVTCRDLSIWYLESSLKQAYRCRIAARSTENSTCRH